MCTTTRSLSTLLNLDTYQGMSDEEIEMVFNFKLQHALTAQEILVNTELRIQRSEAMIQNARDASQRSYNMLKSIVETEFPDIEFEEPQRITPISIVEV